MAQNGPGLMYKLKPYYNENEVIDLPKCMYQARTYVDASGSDLKDSKMSSGEVLDPAVVELEQRQETILKRLEQLKSEVEKLAGSQAAAVAAAPLQQSKAKMETTPAAAPSNVQQKSNDVIRDIVIGADPSSPPLSIFVLIQLLEQQLKVLATCHTHSTASNVPEKLSKVFNTNGAILNRSQYQMALTLIWKKVTNGPTLMVSPQSQTPIEGEGNIARYLARLLNPSYDTSDIIAATEIDNWVDLSSQILRGNNKEKSSVLRTMNSKLGKSSWLVGSDLSLADITLWSAVNQANLADEAPANVKKWIQSCNNHSAFQFAQKVL